MIVVDPSDAGAAAVFAARLLRLSQDALVRIRPAGQGRAALWTALPFRVLATRTVASPLSEDVTVRAADLRDRIEEPERYDGAWRGTLPTSDGRVLETVPAAELRRIDVAAGDALRARRGQGVGDRRLRDALLDHVAITVTHDGQAYEVPVRLIVGLLRMGFAGDGDVNVRLAGRRLGLEGEHGTVWSPAAGLTVL